MWIRLEETWKNIFILKKSAVKKKEETKEKETEERVRKKETEERVRKKECLMFVCLDAAV